jgi:hypothetical protein
MRHIHFGAGHFGLGFATWLFWKAGVPTTLVNRLSTNDSVTAPDTVSSRRRNELLKDRRRYAVSYNSPTAKTAEILQYVSISEFLEYDPNSPNLALLNDHFLSDEPLCLTMSLSALDNYKTPSDLILSCLAKRNIAGITHPVYLMAFENNIATTEVATKFFGGSQQRKDASGIVPLNVSVDRVCSMMNESKGRRPFLEVACEPYAELVIEEHPLIGSLKSALETVKDFVRFSSNIDIEKNKKRWIVNGSHALIALTAAYFGILGMQDFFHKTDLKASAQRPYRLPPTLATRKAFAKGVITEMTDGFRCATQKNSEGRKHLKVEGHKLASYSKRTLDRFIDGDDTTSRIIKHFVAPRLQFDPDHMTVKFVDSYSNFLRWARPRIEEPIRAYMRVRGIAPKHTTEALINMLVMIAEGDLLKNINIDHL